MSDKIRVRYAPSPTGYLHIGNARTALFNYLYARHYDGDFIIRIEDTDQARNIEGGELSQLDNLKWLNIDWDEGPDVGGDYGPYRQSERGDIYSPLVEDLLAKDLAYKAYETPEELEAVRQEQQEAGIAPHYNGAHAHLTEAEQKVFEAEGRKPAIRFRIPEGETYTFNDIVKGDISFESGDLGGDFVIVKADGTPTYNFAVVVDDHMMEITHILRGDDHIANTPKQIAIYEALGWEVPTFGHMTLIVNHETGKKLSKRDTDVLQFIEDYREKGYHPEALFNFIAFLGWTPPGEDEIFSRDELIELFDEKRLSKSPASFDQNKLDWFSGEYIKKEDPAVVAERTFPYLKEAGLMSEDPSEEEVAYMSRIVGLYQEQMEYCAQIVDLSKLFFQDFVISEEAKAVLSEEGVAEVLEPFMSHLDDIEDFKADNIQPAIKATQKETGAKGKGLYMPIRAAVSGEVHGPSLNDTIELLGREKTQSHLEHVLSQIKA